MFCDYDYAPVRRCNISALSYFESHRYSDADVTSVCKELDSHVLFARLTFLGNGVVDIRLSHRTYEIQGGHIGSVSKYFLAVAQHSCLQNARGSLIVWLEDGFWIWHSKYSVKAPILSFGRHYKDDRSFLIPDPAFMGSDGYREDIHRMVVVEKEIPFETRAKTVYFRGAASGCGIEEGEWKNSPRGKVMNFAMEFNDKSKLDAALTRLGHLEPSQQALFEKLGMVAPVVPFVDFLKYRYLLNVDGYCCAWISFFTKLASSSLVVKVESDYSQWYYEDFVPWRHYVPVKGDLSDFNELYSWLVAHDDEVRRMVDNANTQIAEVDFINSIEETAHLVNSILQCRRPDDPVN